MNLVGECVSRPVFGRSIAAGGERAAPDPYRGVGQLHCVVGLREQGEVRRRGHVLAAGPELWQPEAVQVRLVSDDHVVERRQRTDERGRVAREVGLVGGRRAESCASPPAYTETKTRIAGELRRALDVAQRRRARRRSGADSPGCQIDVMRTERKPASRSIVICAFVPTRSGARTTSSAVPSTIVGPPGRAAGTSQSRQKAAASAARSRPHAADTLAAMYEEIRTRLRGLPDRPGRVPVQGRARRGALHRQGEEPAQPRAHATSTARATRGRASAACSSECATSR